VSKGRAAQELGQNVRRARLRPPLQPLDLDELAGRVFDGHADDGAVLSPRAVIVFGVTEAEQLVEHKPRERRALADTAVRNHVFVRGHALVPVQLPQFFRRLEGSVLVGGLRPRNVRGTWYMAGALGGLAHAWR